MTKQNGARPTLRQRISDLWHRTDRARALAQVPVVALGPGAGPVASQVRTALPPDPAGIRQDAERELQKEWAHNELRLRDSPALYVIREGSKDPRPGRAARDAPTQEHER